MRSSFARSPPSALCLLHSCLLSPTYTHSDCSKKEQHKTQTGPNRSPPWEFFRECSLFLASQASKDDIDQEVAANSTTRWREWGHHREKQSQKIEIALLRIQPQLKSALCTSGLYSYVKHKFLFCLRIWFLCTKRLDIHTFSERCSLIF